MADTWTLLCSGVTFAVNETMSGIWNSSATRLLKIRRIGLINYQTVAAAGVVCQLNIQRLTATSSWPPGVDFVAVSALPHDTDNTALDSVTSGYYGDPATTGVTDIVRRLIWSSDEPSLSSATNDEWECLVPLNIVWDCGYIDTNCQPLVLREDEMVWLKNIAGAAGLLDSWYEFTNEAV